MKVWTRIETVSAALVLLVVSSIGQAATGITYYHTDALGSVVAATDESGSVIYTETYRPYGERLEAARPTDEEPVYYTGKTHDDRTGLSYFGARHYDPAFGRFTGIDPANVVPDAPLTFNRYAYANNNPYRYVDPDGWDPHQWVDGNYSDNDGQENPGLTSKVNKAYGRVGEGIAEYGFTHPAVLVGTGELGLASLVKSLLKKNLRQATKRAPNIKWGQQEKHFPGHNSYTPGRSTLTSNPEKLAKQAGTGQQVGKTPVGHPGSKERVDFGERIGTYIDRGGNASDTTKGIIHYGKDGIHIVPARP